MSNILQIITMAICLAVVFIWRRNATRWQRRAKQWKEASEKFESACKKWETCSNHWRATCEHYERLIHISQQEGKPVTFPKVEGYMVSKSWDGLTNTQVGNCRSDPK